MIADRNRETDRWRTKSMPQDCGIMPTLGVTLWMGFTGFSMYLLAYLFLFASPTHRAITIGAVTLSFLLPPNFTGVIGIKIGDWMMLQGEKYFGLTTTIEDEDALVHLAEKHKGAIFALEPHDMLPYPVFAFHPALHRIPGIGENLHCLTSSAIFRIPIVKHIYSWVRTSSVDKQNFKSLLGRGESVVFCPGGIQDLMLTDPTRPNDVVLYLRNRKGFVKLALATGSPIVPAFSFHVDGSYGYLLPHRSLLRIGRMIGVVPMLFWGRFNIPFGIPRPQQIRVVVGEPLFVPLEGDAVKEESVQKYHALFLREMEALFDRHKHLAGCANRTLKIL